MSDTFHFEEKTLSVDPSDPTSLDILHFRESRFVDTARNILSLTWMLLIIPITAIIWTAAFRLVF